MRAAEILIFTEVKTVILRVTGNPADGVRSVYPWAEFASVQTEQKGRQKSMTRRWFELPRSFNSLNIRLPIFTWRPVISVSNFYRNFFILRQDATKTIWRYIIMFSKLQYIQEPYTNAISAAYVCQTSKLIDMGNRRLCSISLEAQNMMLIAIMQFASAARRLCVNISNMHE